jgi:hypothetical protein
VVKDGSISSNAPLLQDLFMDTALMVAQESTKEGFEVIVGAHFDSGIELN